MVNIEIDGIYCSKCRGLHPTLYWHDKYDEYLTPCDCSKKYKAVVVRFGIEYNDEEFKKAYQKRLDSKQIKMMERVSKCTICTSVTKFVDVNTGKYVCSDECLSKVHEKEVCRN